MLMLQAMSGRQFWGACLLAVRALVPTQLVGPQLRCNPGSMGCSQSALVFIGSHSSVHVSQVVLIFPGVAHHLGSTQSCKGSCLDSNVHATSLHLKLS